MAGNFDVSAHFTSFDRALNFLAVGEVVGALAASWRAGAPQAGASKPRSQLCLGEQRTYTFSTTMVSDSDLSGALRRCQGL